jgi:hypothetical protein
MPRKNAFNVPEGYFEELPTAVLLKCSVSKVKKEPLLASKSTWWWSVAACSLLLLGIWFVVPNSTPSSNSLIAKNSLIHVTTDWIDYLAHYACPTVIEDELLALDIDFRPFIEELTSEELLAYDDYLTYSNYYYDFY